MRGLHLLTALAARPRFTACLAISLLTILAAGCATTQTARVERFKESAAVDVELRFFRWDSIYMTKPDTRENGFLPLLNTAQISTEINRRNLRRNVAAVVVGYSYDEAQTAAIVDQWRKFLASQNFKRVVLLRAGGGKTIDGLPVIQDLAINSGDATPGFNPATLATLPTATGADVANPPIASNK
jgi:hypothetical protein